MPSKILRLFPFALLTIMAVIVSVAIVQGCGNDNSVAEKHEQSCVKICDCTGSNTTECYDACKPGGSLFEESQPLSNGKAACYDCVLSTACVALDSCVAACSGS